MAQLCFRLCDLIPAAKKDILQEIRGVLESHDVPYFLDD
jgi:hypothetical protein